MRFHVFCDRYSSPTRAKSLLFAADGLAIVSAVLFASGTPYFGRGPLDAVLLAVWALIPRSTAQVLDRIGIPRGFVFGFLVSIGFVLAVSALIFAGWEIYTSALPLSLPLRLETGVVIVIAWSLGFLLHQPRTYRMQDFLFGAVVLLGLLAGMPHGLFWALLYLLGTLLSLAARRILFDVFPGPRRPPVNLHDARALAVLAASAGLVAIALTWSLLGPSLPARVLPRIQVDLGLYAWNGLALDSELVESSRDGRGVGQREESGGKSTIGFSAEVRLRDLATPRFDERVVFTASGVAREKLRYSPYTLWRVLTFSEYVPENGSWRDDVELARSDWPEDGVIEIDSYERGPLAIDPLDRMRIEIVTPVLQNLASPYFTRQFEDVNVGGSLLDVTEPTRFARSGSDDILIEPSLRRRGSYVVAFDDLPDGRPLPPDVRGRSSSVDARYLAVPGNASVSIDLRQYARREIGSRGSTRAVVGRLLEHLSARFRRTDRYAWTSSGDPLGNFLGRERHGDCTYFATASALLLRAVGVPTRLVVGFVGGERLGDGTIRVRNETAHAWIEVHDDAFGWAPVDPTTWVEHLDADDAPTSDSPTEPDFRDNPEELSAAEIARRDAARDLGTDEETPRADGDEEAGRSRPLAAADATNAERTESDTGEPTSSAAGSWISFVPKELDPFAPRAQSTELQGETERREIGLRSRGAVLRFVLVAAAAATLILGLFAARRARKRDEEELDEEESELSEAEIALLRTRRTSGLGECPENADEALVWEYQRLQADLKLLRSHRRAHETPLEHGARYAGQNERLDSSFARIHRWLYTVLYGRRAANESALREVRESSRAVRRILR